MGGRRDDALHVLIQQRRFRQPLRELREGRAIEHVQGGPSPSRYGPAESSCSSPGSASSSGTQPAVARGASTFMNLQMKRVARVLAR